MIDQRDINPQGIFVFGSNLAGVHGAGAAARAHKDFGARMGLGVGMWGNSYAIPTKDYNIETMPLHEIKPYVTAFLQFASLSHRKLGAGGKKEILQFHVTRIGCGLAGYNDYDIAPLFYGAGENVHLPDEWRAIHIEMIDRVLELTGITDDQWGMLSVWSQRKLVEYTL